MSMKNALAAYDPARKGFTIWDHVIPQGISRLPIVTFTIPLLLISVPGVGLRISTGYVITDNIVGRRQCVGDWLE